jgi:hypothetical protein
VRVFPNVLAWWRRPVRRVRAMVVVDAASDPFTPLPLPALRRSVPGNAGWGSRAGAALCPAPAPSMDDTLDRYRHFLAGTPPHVLPARPVPTLFTLMRKVPYGPLYPE